MSLVICKNGGTCAYSCDHKKPHEREKDCGKGSTDCHCVPVLETEPEVVMVKCNIADECNKVCEDCEHKVEHRENERCKSKCTFYEEAKCEPANNSPEAKAFILTPSEDHPEANITIQAKDRTEALETALKQLGWKLL